MIYEIRKIEKPNGKIVYEIWLDNNTSLNGLFRTYKAAEKAAKEYLKKVSA